MKTISTWTRTLEGCLALAALLFGTQIASAQEYCLSSSTNQVTGTRDGYRYELWNPVGAANPADECMTVNSGATFSGKWTNADDYLARRGVFYGSNTGQNWKQRGGMQIYYVANWQPQFVTGGNSSLGVYGWVHRGNNNVGSTAEFYIIENWYQWNHSQDSSRAVTGKGRHQRRRL